jgi:hypothetical protein
LENIKIYKFFKNRKNRNFYFLKLEIQNLKSLKIFFIVIIFFFLKKIKIIKDYIGAIIK